MPADTIDNINLTGLKQAGVDPIVISTYEALKKYKDASQRKDAMRRRKEAWKAAIENEMWEDSDKAEMKKTGQVPVVYNKLNKGIQGNAALVTSNDPEIKILPTRMNDPYVSELLKWGVDFVWAKNDGNDVVFAWVEEKNIGGLSWVSAMLDENKGIFGRIVFDEQDPTMYYFDPESRDRYLRDTHIIKAQLRTKSYIKENYPDVKDDDLVYQKSEPSEDETGKLTDTVIGADNYAINPDKSDTDAPPDDEEKREIWEIECYWLKTEKEWWAIIVRKEGDDPEPVKLKIEKGQKAEDVLEAWKEQKNPVSAELWPRQMKNRYLRIIVGKAIIKQTDPENPDEQVDERKNPYGLDSDGDPVLPCIPLKGQRTLNAFCMSPTMYSLPINRSYNKRQAQMLYAVSKGLNAPVVRSKDSKWTGPPDKPGSEIEIGVNTPAELRPYRLSPGTVDVSGLARLIAEDQAAIDDQFDLPEVLRGKIPKGQENMSGRLGLALQDSASVMNNPHLRSLETALVMLARVILSIMLRSWPRFMWERLVQTDEARTFIPPSEQNPAEEQPEPGSEEEAAQKQQIAARWQQAIDTVVEEGVTLIDLDIRVTAGSSLPTNRAQRNAEAREMYKEGLFGRLEALEHSNYPGAKEIAERMDKREQEMIEAGMKQKRK